MSTDLLLEGVYIPSCMRRPPCCVQGLVTQPCICGFAAVTVQDTNSPPLCMYPQNPGNITVAEVLAMLPYANAVAIFTISGQVLLDAVKNGLSLYPNGGRFLQVSRAAISALFSYPYGVLFLQLRV